jgi:ATP-binding cassette, subfamily B, bacterial
MQFPIFKTRADTNAPRSRTKRHHDLTENSAATLPTRPTGRVSRFFSYYRPHLGVLALDLICAALVAATAVAVPLCANYITSQLLELPGEPHAMAGVWTVGALMLGLLVVGLLASYFVDYQGHMMGARIEAALRREMFDHCQKLSFTFYDRNRVGQLMSRITNDTFWLGELFHHGPEDFAIGLLKYVGAMAVLAFIDPVLMLMILGLTPFAIVYALHFNGKMSVALQHSKERIAGVNERVEDALSGIRVVQSFGNQALESDRFDHQNERFLDSRRMGYRSEAWFSAGMESFAQLVTILVIVVGAMRILWGELTIPGMLTFLLCVAVLVDPVKRLANLARLWQEGYTGFVRAMDLLDVAPDITDRDGAVAMPRPGGAIRFEAVSFDYGDDRPDVFTDLSLDIAPGEFVALVGASGVGKSTLCALIPRFYEVTAGRILIDGTDIRDVTLASLRSHIGVVQQDVYLFSGTIADNLRYGRPDATDEELVAAARAAHAHDFIMELPQGYDTDIGQRGVRLSGGQKQRLTIARVFLKNPAILIFDEATSALDNESERAVQSALLELAQGRTTLVIAHRLSTVRHADRILVMTPDGISEQGTHETLVAQNGLYAALHRDQARI